MNYNNCLKCGSKISPDEVYCQTCRTEPKKTSKNGPEHPLDWEGRSQRYVKNMPKDEKKMDPVAFLGWVVLGMVVNLWLVLIIMLVAGIDERRREMAGVFVGAMIVNVVLITYFVGCQGY